MIGINGTLAYSACKWHRYIWLGAHDSFRGTSANHVNVCLRSLRQRRGERGHVHPGQPSERGHPTQLHQHLQRRRLLLRDPGCPRSVHWCRHNKPEHRGEPATEEHAPGTAARQLMVLPAGRGDASRAPSPEGRSLLSASVRTPYLLFIFHESVATENNFSAIIEDKRTGTLGVGCKILVYASCDVFIALLWCFYL